MDLRQFRGIQIAEANQVKRLDDGFAVRSQNSKRYYFVANGDCTCPDCQTRQVKCKHQFAVEYFFLHI